MSVIDLTRETVQTDLSVTGQIAVVLVEAIDASFMLQHVPHGEDLRSPDHDFEATMAERTKS